MSINRHNPYSFSDLRRFTRSNTQPSILSFKDKTLPKQRKNKSVHGATQERKEWTPRVVLLRQCWVVLLLYVFSNTDTMMMEAEEPSPRRLSQLRSLVLGNRRGKRLVRDPWARDSVFLLPMTMANLCPQTKPTNYRSCQRKNRSKLRKSPPRRKPRITQSRLGNDTPFSCFSPSDTIMRALGHL